MNKDKMIAKLSGFFYSIGIARTSFKIGIVGILSVFVMFMAACCHLTTPPEPAPEIKTVEKVSPSKTPPVKVAAVKPLPSHTDPRFMEGFELGVKWGITSFMRHPEKQDVNYHIFEAKKWYWLVVVDEGKTLMKATK